MANKFISIVIPVYNSESSLTELHDAITKVMSTMFDSYEIIFIDDSSTDNSWEKLKTLHDADKKVKIIRLQKNFGQANAILCGLNYANGDYIVTMDDDLQHPPEEIPKLINKIQEGFYVVYGEFPIKYHSRKKNFFSSIFQTLKRRILELPPEINTSTFAVYSSNIIKNMIKINSSYVFIPALVQATTPIDKIGCVAVSHQPRKYGQSNYNFRKYLSHSLTLLINYSALPLQFIGILGIIVGFGSFIYGSYIICRYILDPTYGFMGWNSIMVAMTFLGGLILCSIAILGEYIRRILTEVSHSQKFLIAEMRL